MLQKQKLTEVLSFLILLFSTIWLKEINFLFYDSTESPDFAEYFVYFDHFANSNFKTGREHGLMYYYIHYIIIISNTTLLVMLRCFYTNQYKRLIFGFIFMDF